MMNSKFLITILSIFDTLSTIGVKSNNDGIPVLSVRNPEKEVANRQGQDNSYEFSESEDESDETPRLVLKSEDLRPIGCYDAWENKYAVVDTHLSDDHPPYNRLHKCLQVCELKRLKSDTPYKDFIVSVRDKACFCTWKPDFTLVRVKDAYCSIPCPFFSPDHRKCGGSFSFSSYCIRGTSGCDIRPPIQNLYEDDNALALSGHAAGEPFTSDDFEFSRTQLLFKQNEEIFKCANCRWCRDTLTPWFDYIPRNTPAICVQFCKRRITYKPGPEGLRRPMNYALAGWVNKSVLLPACACTNELGGDVSMIGEDECNSSCGGNSRLPCGSESQIDSSAFIFSVYPTGIDTVIVPQPGDCPTSTSISIVPSSEGTTITTMIPSTVPTSKTTSDYEESESSESTENDQGSSTLTVAPPLPPPPVCGKKCYGVDPSGSSWQACAGEVVTRECPNGASGQASWYCLPSGDFQRPTPSYEKCTTEWLKELRKQIDVSQISADEILARTQLMCEKAKLLANTDAQYFGHEIQDIMELVEVVIKHENLTLGLTLPEFEDLTQHVISIGSSVLLHPRTWSELPAGNRSESITSLFRSLEESSFELAGRAENFGLTHYNKSFVSQKVSMIAGVVSRLDGGILKFEDGESSITLPEGWGNVLPPTADADSHFSGIAIGTGNHITNVFPTDVSGTLENKKSINGKIISLSLTRPTDTTIDIAFPEAGVDIRIKHEVHAHGGERRDLRRKLHYGEVPTAILGTAICVYWNTSLGLWSRDGCRLVHTNAIATQCECSHLTSFGILMDRYNYVGKPVALEILTLVLCSLSVVCLFATIVIFSMVNATHGATGTTITKHLAFCLLVGNTLILLVVDRNYLNMSEAVCMAAGIVTHYVFLCGFMWMAMEGYHLYKLMVHVFDSGRSHITMIRILAYGSPLILVVTTAVIGSIQNERAYGGPEFCWLNGNYIYTFMVPVALIVCGNLVVLVITLRTAYRVKATPGLVDRRKSYRTWIRGCFSITLLLGSTWIVGYFQFVGSTVSQVSAYLFTILNASQGIFLFVFHCLLNEKVRMAAERRNIHYPAWLSASGVASSAGQSAASPPNSRFGKQNIKSFYSESMGNKGELHKPDPIHGLVVGRFSVPGDVSSSSSSSNLSSILNEAVSSSNSECASSNSGNETNGSQNMLIQHIRKSKRF